MKLLTIGFTKKSAEEFFAKLKRPDIRRLLDIRLNNSSQLAGFTKRNDLAYFCRSILGIDYRHLPDLAPTEALLDEYKRSSRWIGRTMKQNSYTCCRSEKSKRS